MTPIRRDNNTLTPTHTRWVDSSPGEYQPLIQWGKGGKGVSQAEGIIHSSRLLKWERAVICTVCVRLSTTTERKAIFHQRALWLGLHTNGVIWGWSKSSEEPQGLGMSLLLYVLCYMMQPWLTTGQRDQSLRVTQRVLSFKALKTCHDDTTPCLMSGSPDQSRPIFNEI